jgi:hypothetical protein
MNPFRETIVSDPWRAAAADVPEIQADVFSECLKGVEHVRRVNRSAALLIHGGAGSGKTHLLSRLRARLTLQAPTATDREECLFVWVRLQASPRMIWRHVRRTLVEDWFRPVRGQSTQFERILFHRLAEIRIAEGDLEPWYEYMLESHPAGLDELLEQVCDRLYLDRNTTIAFKHLAFGRHARDLRAWLGGDSLPEEALARLDLSQEDGTDEEREHEARRVVLMLCRLAGDRLPIVVSLDQVEALQTSATDRESLFSFGQLVSTLHDETSNVFLISCVQSAYATELKDKSRGADCDRMTSLGSRSLATLTRSEAEKLIAARLATTGPSASLPKATDSLWPLEPNDFHRLIALNELTPRRLLATCAERFENWTAQATRGPAATGSTGHPPDIRTPEERNVAVATFLGEEWAARVERQRNASDPERTEEIVRHGLPRLLGLIARDWTLTDDEELPDVHLILTGPTGKIGVSVSTQANMRNVGEQLKRLRLQWSQQRLTRLIVVRDTRLPLSKGAKVARQTLEELEQSGAVIVQPSLDVLAALDALRDLLSDARSGDLAHNGEPVLPLSAEAWLQQHLPDELRQFVAQLVTAAPPPRVVSESPEHLQADGENP